MPEGYWIPAFCTFKYETWAAPEMYYVHSQFSRRSVCVYVLQQLTDLQTQSSDSQVSNDSTGEFVTCSITPQVSSAHLSREKKKKHQKALSLYAQLQHHTLIQDDSLHVREPLNTKYVLNLIHNHSCIDTHLQL